MKNKLFGNSKILLIGTVIFSGGLVGSHRRVFERSGMNVLSFDLVKEVPKLLQRHRWEEGDRLTDKAIRRFKASLLHFLVDGLLRSEALSISLPQEAGFGDVSERIFVESAIPVIADVERDGWLKICARRYKY